MISVVIPTYNRLESLKRVLAALEDQTFSLDDFEVVVVSDGSVDGTNEYIRNTQTSLDLKLFVQENRGPAAARNLGLAGAVGELILFIDDDVVPDDRLIEEHMGSHDREVDEVVVIGPMLAPPDFRLDPWTGWMQDRLVEQYQAMVSGQWRPTARQFYTGNTSLSRKLLLENDGFDPAFLRAEDVELAYRLADKEVRFLFNPDAKGYHYEERSFESWLAIPYAYGRYDVVFAYQKGQLWLLERLFQEYKERMLWVRGLTSLCLDRPHLSAALIKMMKLLAITGKNTGFNPLIRLACSSIFNLRHYQGVADELGGRQLFFSGVAGKLNHPAHAGDRHQKVPA